MAKRKSLIQERERANELKSSLPAIKGGDATYHLGLRQHANLIKDKIFLDKIKNPSYSTSAVIESNAIEGRRTATSLRRTINPISLPAPIEAQAKLQTESLLGSTNVPTLDVKNFDSWNPLLKNIDREAGDFGDQDFTDSDIRRAERERTREYDGTVSQQRFFSGATEEEQNSLISTLGIDPNSRAGALLKECIPCGLRPLSLDDLEFSDPFADTLEDLKRKLEDLKKLLGALLLGDEFEEDLCDLLKLWDAQCIPDLFGIISLLGVLSTKYTDGLANVWRNALNSLIAPLLSPVIGPFVHNLERYVDMIVDPLTCVVEALESQMYKLDVVGASNKVQAHRRAFNRKKADFYDRKISSLKRRQRTINNELEQMRKDGELQKNSSFETSPKEKVDANNPAQNTVRTFPRHKSQVPFTGTTEDPSFVTGSGEGAFANRTLSNVDFLPEAQNFDNPLAPPKAFTQSFQEELQVIGTDIDNAERERDKLRAANRNINNVDGGAYNKFHKGITTTLEDSKEAIEDAGEAVKSIIYQVTFGINQGIQLIRDTLEMYRTELERTITGRIQTQEDQIELARTLQQIQRWVSIVNALIKLKKNGWNLEELCDRGTNRDAMGAFVGAFKTEPVGGNFNFYSGTDNNGNDLMVIAPGGAKIDVTSIDFEDIGEDDLFNEVQLDDVQTTATFNDLNEADELNRKGVLLDLGNISDKDITVRLDDATSEKTDLDLRAANSYVIIKNDFCSKSPIKGTSSTVRQWADNL